MDLTVPCPACCCCPLVIADVTEDNVWNILPAKRDECRKMIAQKLTKLVNLRWSITDAKLIQGSSSMKAAVLTDHQAFIDLISDDNNEVRPPLYIGDYVTLVNYKRKDAFVNEVPQHIGEYCDMLKNLWALRPDMNDLLAPLMASSAVKGDTFVWRVLYDGGVPIQCCEKLKQIQRGTYVCLWRENENVLHDIMNLLK